MLTKRQRSWFLFELLHLGRDWLGTYSPARPVRCKSRLFGCLAQFMQMSLPSMAPQKRILMGLALEVPSACVKVAFSASCVKLYSQ